MKKIILLFAMLLAVAGVQAKTSKIYASFQAVANNNNVSWDSSTNKLSVWGENSNTYQMFSFPAGTLKKYKQMSITITDKDHTQILFMNANGETLHTWKFGSNSAKTETFANMETSGSYTSKLTSEELENVTEIRIKGLGVSSYTKDSPCTISIDPATVYIDSDEYEGNTTSFSSLTTGGTWSSTLPSLPLHIYRKAYNDDTDLSGYNVTILGSASPSKSNYADVTDYRAIIFKVENVTTSGGGKIRVWAFSSSESSETALVERWAYPVGTTPENWATQPSNYDGNSSHGGYYYFDLSDYDRLAAVKTNAFSSAVDYNITEVYLVKNELTITDGFDMADMVNDPIGATVKYKRTFTAGTTSTICLPFALTQTEADAAGDFYEFTGESSGTLTFTKITSGGTAAYTPYIFKAKSDGTPFANLTGKAIVASEGNNCEVTQGNYTFQGTLAHVNDVASANSSNTVYGWSSTDGTFKKAGTGVSIDAFRAYVIGPASSPSRSLNAVFDDDETTGIQNIEVNQDNTVSDGAVYNIMGQRVSQNHKGLVIKNGRKVIVK